MLDDDFLMLINAWWEPLTFTVPADFAARRWDIVCDTYDPARAGAINQQVTVGPRSAVVLQSQSGVGDATPPDPTTL
jgi:isoamylase